MNTHQGDIEAIMEMVLDGNTERAIGALWMLKERLRRDRIEARAREDDLPPLSPLGDRRVTAPSMQCPLCKAKPGKPCVKISGRGLPGVEMGEPLAGGAYHNARIQRAKEASS